MIRFLLNDTSMSLSAQDANQTVLSFLREQQKLTGTKEGCAAGDCGACTVVVAELSDTEQGLHYRSINSCIALMSSLHGKQLITVEHLKQGNTLHPVQQAMVNEHGSQCGFCTPGFVMSMFALYQQQQQAPALINRHSVDYALSGNLCRCTGYRPIIDATLAACATPQSDQFARQRSATIDALNALRDDDDILASSGLLLPVSREQLAQCIAAHPDAPLVAGSTDLSLEITQQHRRFDTLISLSQIPALKQISIDSQRLRIGAACALSDIEKPLLTHFPQLQELFERFASLPVRNQATLGGNIANASPIGDMPPVMLALNATFVADNGNHILRLPANEFFTGYRQTTLPSGYWLSAIDIPLLSEQQRLAAFKVSKRTEDDISAICAVFNVTVDNDGIVTDVATGFGGVAATPVSTTALAKAIAGKPLTDAQTLQAGKAALRSAFSPIDDVRATARYRNQLAENLWHRFWLQQQTSSTIETRVNYHA